MHVLGALIYYVSDEIYRVWPEVLGNAARFCANYHILSNRKKEF